MVMRCWWWCWAGCCSARTLSGGGRLFRRAFGAGSAGARAAVARYAGNEAIWALCLGTAFSLPLWDAAKNAGAKIGGFIPARGRKIYFGLGQVIEIVLVVALLLISAAWLAGGTYNPFIYFRF